MALCLTAAPLAPAGNLAFAKTTKQAAKPDAVAAQKPAADAAAEPSGKPASAEPQAPEEIGYPVSSIVVDLETEKVLSQENATERRYAASTTKLMTAFLALKALRAETVGLDSPVIMTSRASEEPPSKMGYQPGSVMRLDNAMRMMLVKSANDVAYAIGQMLGGGSMDTFVDMMNAEAAELGMKDTRYVNANGLPQEGQYQSAKDLAILAIAIRKQFPAFSDYFGTEAISNGRALIKNGNKLLGRFDGADGMKTGFTCAAGFNLVSSATRDGRTIIAAVMGANGTIARERHTAEIIDAGFKTDPASVTTKVEDLPTSAGEPLDISDYICGAKGRTARANERVEERKRTAGEAQDEDTEIFGSPYMHEMNRAPVTVSVGLGGAAGNAIAAPGISLIAAYGIPIPTPRPTPPSEKAPNGEAPDAAPVASPEAESAPEDMKTVATSGSAVEDAQNFVPSPGPSPEAAKGPRIDILGEDGDGLRAGHGIPVPTPAARAAQAVN
nr:D-alanyl-D-alanine carboxypeptidase family protein [Aurantimonas sp. VKM B-3413]